MLFSTCNAAPSPSLLWFLNADEVIVILVLFAYIPDPIFLALLDWKLDWLTVKLWVLLTNIAPPILSAVLLLNLELPIVTLPVSLMNIALPEPVALLEENSQPVTLTTVTLLI